MMTASGTPGAPPDRAPDFALLAELARLDRGAAQGNEDDAARLLPWLAEEREDPASAALRALAVLVPTAALPPRFAESGLDNAPVASRDKADLPAWLADAPDAATLARLCVEELRRLRDNAARVRLLRRLARLPGLQDELAARLAAEASPAETAAFRHEVAALEARQYPRQLTFAPTMRCGLRCPYCIAAGSAGMDAAEANETTVNQLLAWMRRHGVRRLGLTGGEPTGYSRFPWLLQRLRALDIEYYLASHGLMPAPALDALAAHPPLCLTLHLTPETLGAPDKLATFTANARRLREAGVFIALRLTLSGPENARPDILDLAQTCGIRELRVAAAMPNARRVNRFVDGAELAVLGPMLSRLAARAEARGIQVHLAKPYPLCLLDETTARHFLKNGSLAGLCPAFRNHWANNLVVYPDRRFSACLGLDRRSSRPITDFAGPEAAARLFAPDCARRTRLPLLARCRHCPLGPGGRCVGACLGYRPETQPEGGQP